MRASPPPLRGRVDRAEGIRARSGRGVRIAKKVIARGKPLSCARSAIASARAPSPARGEGKRVRRSRVCPTCRPNNRDRLAASRTKTWPHNAAVTEELEDSPHAGALSQRHVELRAEGAADARRERPRMGEPASRPARRRASAGLVRQAQSARGGADADRRRYRRAGIQRHQRISRRALSRSAAQARRSVRPRQDAAVDQAARRGRARRRHRGAELRAGVPAPVPHPRRGRDSRCWRAFPIRSSASAAAT